MPVVGRAERDELGSIWGIYSPSGYGKTTLAAALAKVQFERTNKPMLFADWEYQTGGATCLPKWVPFELWIPGSGDAIDESYAMLKEAESDRYSGLVVDTLSTLGDLALDSTCAKNIKADKGSETRRPYFDLPSGRRVNGASQNDYGITQQGWFKPWFAAHGTVIKQGKMVLWCSHEKYDEKHSVGGPKIVGSALINEAPKVMQECLRITAVMTGPGVVRLMLQTGPGGNFIAKDRLVCLNPAGVEIGVARPEGASGEQHQKLMIERGEQVWRHIFAARDRMAGSQTVAAMLQKEAVK